MLNMLKKWKEDWKYPQIVRSYKNEQECLWTGPNRASANKKYIVIIVKVLLNG